MATTKTKRINWLFPNPNVEVTEEDILAEIRRAERSGSMTLEEFNQRHLHYSFAIISKSQSKV